MKKWLAWLSVMVVLLCAAPVTVATVSAEEYDGNLLSFGDFEGSYGYHWDYYQSTYVCGDAAFNGYNGAKLQGYGGWGALLEQTVSVDLGQAYRLEFWFKVVQNGFNWRLEQGGGEGLYETGWETDAEWTYVSYDFVASSEWVTLNFCGSGNGIPEVVYLDDVVITPIDYALYDGYIYNGDFEYHQFLGWSVYQGTGLSPYAAAGGDNGALLQGNGGWGALLEQGFFTEPGAEYELTFSYKVMSNGFNLQILDGYYGEKLAGDWYTDTEWTEGVVTFTAVSETTRLNFCGGGNGIPESVYLDDVVLLRVDGEYPDDPEYPDITYDVIMAGETKEVTVDEEFGMNFYLFIPTESGWYAFSSAGEYDTYFAIADESGENVLMNDNDADGRNFRAVTYCEADALYVLMVTTTEFSGTFDLTVESVTTDEMFPDATAIRYGDTAVVELEQMGVGQAFSFVPEQDGTYIFTAYGEVDTYCYLYDVEGKTLLMFDDEYAEEDNFNFAASYDCVAGNTYYFLVSAFAEEAVSFTVTLTAEEEPPSPEILLGDANGDGKVNNRDLALLQQYLNYIDLGGKPFVVSAADLNGDGKVNNRDLGLLQRLLNS